MKILHDLLAIKRFREGKAETSMRIQRQALLLAQEERMVAEALLKRLLDEGVLAEQKFYQDLCARIVRLRDIQEVQQAVAVLRQREQQQQDALEDAESQQQQAQLLFDDSRLVHKEAMRQTSKFVDLAGSFAILHAQESERREDQEMEEAASATREREDWGNADGATT